MSFIPSVIKTIRRGTVTITVGNNAATVVEAGITFAHASLRFLGGRGGSNSGNFAYIFLTQSGSDVVINAASIWNVGADVVLEYEVTEYIGYFIKKIQRGVLAVVDGGGGGNYSNTAALTAVVTGKSLVSLLGFASSDNVSGFIKNWWMSLALTSTVLLTGTIVSSNTLDTVYASWEVVEFR